MKKIYGLITMIREYLNTPKIMSSMNSLNLNIHIFYSISKIDLIMN